MRSQIASQRRKVPMSKAPGGPSVARGFVLALLLVAVGGGQAFAHRSPSNCNANRLTLDQNPAGNIVSEQTVTYTVGVFNPGPEDQGVEGSQQPGASEDADGVGEGHVRDLQREDRQADQVRGGAVHRRRFRVEQRGRSRARPPSSLWPASCSRARGSQSCSGSPPPPHSSPTGCRSPDTLRP